MPPLPARRVWMSTAAAVLPVVGLLSFFIWAKQPVPSDTPSALALARGLLRLDSLVALRQSEELGSTAVVALFACLLVRGLASLYATRRVRPSDAWLAAAGAFTLLYFLAPRRIAGGAYVNERLQLFPFFALLPWYASQPFPPALRKLVQITGAALALSSLCLHVAAALELRPQAAEMLSVGDRLVPGRTLLPLSFAQQGWGLARERPRVKVFLHAASYLAAERGLVNLANYEGNYVHFPLIFRDEVNPFVHLAAEQGLEGEPPCADLDNWTRSTGRSIDYVLLWGLRGRRLDGEPCANRMLDQIDRDYDLVHVSERKLVRLYERRGGGTP